MLCNIQVAIPTTRFSDDLLCRELSEQLHRDTAWMAKRLDASQRHLLWAARRHLIRTLDSAEGTDAHRFWILLPQVLLAAPCDDNAPVGAAESDKDPEQPGELSLDLAHVLMWLLERGDIHETAATKTDSAPTVDTKTDSAPTVDTKADSAPTVDTKTDSAPTVDTKADSAPTVDTKTDSAPTVDTKTDSAPTVDTKADSAPTVDTAIDMSEPKADTGCQGTPVYVLWSLLLPASQQSETVRRVALACLAVRGDEVIVQLLPQLLRLVRMEDSVDTPLARMLLMRALRSPMYVGHHFYWTLRTEVAATTDTDNLRHMQVRFCFCFFRVRKKWIRVS